MKLLLLNTCGAEGSVALADSEVDAPVIAQVAMPGRTASERLVAIVRETMTKAGWKLRDLAAIAVVTGPGSFTGVRVGLSAAKGFAEASDVPLIAISRLAMLAAAAGLDQEKVCALLDAGRGEFYYGEYQGSKTLKEALVSREDAACACGQVSAAMVCEEVVMKTLGTLASLRMGPDPAAADALPLALKRLMEGSFDDAMTLDANYLRRTDAEIFAKPAARAD